MIYFRGTDDRLLRINSDGTNSFQIGTNTTSSSPFVFSDPVSGEWVYFRGKGDNQLWKVRSDAAGSDLTKIGFEPSSTHLSFGASTNDVWIYFQGRITDY